MGATFRLGALRRVDGGGYSKGGSWGLLACPKPGWVFCIRSVVVVIRTTSAEGTDTVKLVHGLLDRRKRGLSHAGFGYGHLGGQVTMYIYSARVLRFLLSSRWFRAAT